MISLLPVYIVPIRQEPFAKGRSHPKTEFPCQPESYRGTQQKEYRVADGSQQVLRYGKLPCSNPSKCDRIIVNLIILV
jgi:hypothetical protein